MARVAGDVACWTGVREGKGGWVLLLIDRELRIRRGEEEEEEEEDTGLATSLFQTEETIGCMYKTKQHKSKSKYV